MNQKENKHPEIVTEKNRFVMLHTSMQEDPIRFNKINAVYIYSFFVKTE